MTINTTIIGGGSAGLYFSRLYKEKKPEEETEVIEEHKETGRPVQCTGILTKELEKLIPVKDIKKFTLNKITKTEIFSPNNSVITPISTDYIICNVSFIEYLQDKAERAGVKIKQGYRYIENKGKTVKIRDIDTKKVTTYNTQHLVGADGPASSVAKNNGLYGTRNFLTGVQARIKLKDFDKEKIDFYPYIGEYAWFTPESDTIARVGVAASKNAKRIFDDFIKRYPGKILEMQGGPIPKYKPRTEVWKKEKDFTLSLIGDAALQIKNTTGGGIIPGLKAARILSKNIHKYPANIKSLNKELYLHYLLNKLLKRYTYKDWDRLIEKTKKPSIKKILISSDRDNAINMVFRLALQPKMALEGLNALTKLIKYDEATQRT